MKMSEVKVGMILRDPIKGVHIMVTEITNKGFRYSLDTDDLNFIPRLNITFAKHGHHYFGVNGECHFELVKT